MKDILIVIGLVALAMILLCVRVILKKNGKFSSQDVGSSPAMRKRGIHCIRKQDWLERQENKNKIDVSKL